MSFILEPRLLFDASVGATTKNTTDSSTTTTADAAKPVSDTAAAPAAAPVDQSSTAATTDKSSTATDASKSAAATTTATIADHSPSSANSEAAKSVSADPSAAAGTSATSATPIDTVLFVDPRVSNWQELANSVGASTKVVVIDPTKDGITQVTQALQGMTGLKEVDFLSYGQSGQIEFGGSAINDAVLNANAGTIAGWANSFAPNAQIQFWGCDVGAGDAGAAFVNDLHAITGAGVAASTDATGAATLGGDWALERTAGVVTASTPFSLDAEAHYDNVLDVPLPTVTFSNVPSQVLLGTGSFTETITFDNTATTAVGYGPFIELFVPQVSATGEKVSLTSATYLGAAVTTQTVTLSTTVPGHSGVLGAIDPLYLDSSGSPQFVAAPAGFSAGDTMYVLTLPFGSFTPNQPAADIVLTFSQDSKSNLGASALNIKAVGGFQFGADALNNPSSDPSIRGTDGTTNAGMPTAGDGLATATSAVTLINVATSVDYHEGETATGQDFPGNYIITVTPAPATNGDAISNLDLVVTLPSDIVYTGGAIGHSGATSAIFSGGTVGADGLTHGGTVTVHYNSLASASSTVAAVASTITVPFYVPEHTTTTAQELTPGGSNGWHTIDATPFYSYTASNWSNTTSGAFDSTGHTVSFSGAGSDVQFVAKTLAIQVSDTDITSGGSGLLPDDIYQYTINFQVSDFYNLTNLVINDVLGDGMNLLVDAGHTPTLTINNNGTNSTPSFGTLTGDAGTTVNGQSVVTSNSNSFWSYSRNNTASTVGGITAGATGLQFNVSTLLGTTIVGDNDHSSGGTTGTITFYAKALQKYTETLSQASIRENDTISNSVSGAATAAGNDTTVGALGNTSQNGTVSDTSSVSNTEATGNLTLIISDVNGVDVTSDPTIHFQAGDEVTYTLTYTLTAGDYGNLDLNAFLPLPVFTVPASLTVDSTPTTDGSGHSVPATGKFVITSNPSIFGANNPTTASGTALGNANGIQFGFGTFDTTTNTAGQTVTVKFTLTASNDPFADGLALTTQGQSTYTNAGGTTQANAVIKQQVMDEPELKIKTGVVSDRNDGSTGNQTTASYTADGSGSSDPTAIFDVAGSGDIFADAGHRTSADTTPAAGDQNLTGADAKDTTRIVETVTNTGKGQAYDVIVNGTLPSGYTTADVSNLQIVRGDGTVLGYTAANSAAAIAAFFSGSGLQLKDTATTNAVLRGTGDATHGDVLYVSYDLTLAATAAPASVLTANGKIVNWTAHDGATGFVSGGSAIGVPASNLTDNATITLSSAAFAKTLTGGSGPNGIPTSLALPNVVVGETLTYTFTLTVPEGNMTSVNLTDTLPAFLDASTAVLGTAPSLPTNLTSTVTVDNTTIHINTTTGAITANFGDLTNATDGAKTITFTIKAQVKDSTNVNGSTIVNSAQVTSGNSPTLNSSVTATEKDPNISETITASTGSNPVFSGENITYTISITNNGTSAAEDLAETITLPSGLTWVASSLTQTSALTGVTVDDTARTISISELAVGATATFTFHATVNDNLASGTTETVSKSGTYTSMPGTVTGERSYNTSANTNVTTGSFTPAIWIVDQSNSTTTTDGGTQGTQAAPQATADGVIGEVVRMIAYVEVPYGQNANASLELGMPAGLLYLNDGTTTFAFYSQNAGDLTTDSTTINNISGGTLPFQQTDTAGFNPKTSGNPTTLLPSGAIAQTNGGSDNGSNVVTFSFGTLTDNNTSAATAGVKNYVAVEFNALVTNVSGNQGGTTLTTKVGVNAANTAPGGGAPSDVVTLKEPTVTVSKSILSVDNSGGANNGTITWQVTVTNANTANATTAYNVDLDDVLTSGQTNLQVNTKEDNTGAIVSQAVQTTGAVSNVSTASSTSTHFIATLDLAKGASATFTYTTKASSLTSPITADPTNVTYTDLNENTNTSNAARFTVAGSNVSFYGTSYGTTSAFGHAAAGAAEGQRNGQDGVGGALNDYAASASLGLGVVTGTVWDDLGDPLSTTDLTIGTTGTYSSLSTKLSGVEVDATWSGQTNVVKVNTDSNGNYSFLAPNVVTTISNPTAPTGETLVYNTNGGGTFHHTETGLTGGNLTESVTPNSGTSTGVNFVYRQPDTAPVITGTGSTSVSSWSSTPTATASYTAGSAGVTLSTGATEADTQLEQLVGLGSDYQGTVLTIVRNGGANATDLFGGSSGANASTGLFLSAGTSATNQALKLNGTTIGTYTESGGTLTITFGTGTTHTTVENVLNMLTYSTVAATTLAGNITLNATLTDDNTQTGTTQGGVAGATNTYQGTGGVLTSAAAHVTLNIVPAAVTDTYVEPNNTSGTPTAASAAVVVLPSIAVPTGQTFSSVTLTLDHFASGEDVINFTAVPGTMGNITATTNSGGVLTLTSAGSTATAAQWQTALQSITYYDSSNTPGDGTANSTTTARNVTIDAVTGTDHITGTVATMTVSPTNDSPVLGAPLVSTIYVNGTTGLNVAPTSGTTGMLVSTFVDGTNITDVDAAGNHDGTTTGVLGIAITQADSSQGKWWYSIDNGTSWTQFAGTGVATQPSLANALHLLSTDRIYFEPTATTNASVNPALSFKAWDQFDSIATPSIVHGASTNIGTTGFGTGTNTAASAYSSATDTISLAVPLPLTPYADTYIEPNNTSGTPTNQSAEVAILPGLTLASGQTFTSVALTLANYQSSEDVIDFTVNTTTMGTHLSATNVAGVLTLTDSGGTTTSQWQAALQAVKYYNTNNTPDSAVTAARNVSVSAAYAGGTFSETIATITVSPTNDSPVLGAPIVSSITVSEDNNPVNTAPTGSSSGILVSSFAASGVGGDITDVDLAGNHDGTTNGVTAIAITQADSSEGNWWFSTNGGTSWTQFAGTGVATQPSTANALHLRSTDLIYFEPTVAHWAGTINPALSFKAWDQFDGVTNGTSTNINTSSGNYGENAAANAAAGAYSSATDTLSLAITQTVTLSPVLKIVDESNGTEATDSNNSATLTPSQTNNVGSSDAVIGEIVRMKVYVEVPTGNNNVVINLTMPSGLSFLNDGSETLALTAQAGTLTSTTETGASVAQGGGFDPLTFQPTATFSDASKITVSGNNVSFNLGDVGNTNAGSTSNYVIIEFNTLVKNVAGNTDGTSLTTQATVTGTATTATDTVNVKEPNVTITKTITNIDQATGVVTWQDVVTNNGDTTAYNVTLNDVSSSTNESTINAGSLTQSGNATSVNVTSGVGTHTLGATMNLAAGKSETFTYQTTITGTVPDVTATTVYTSLNHATSTTGPGFAISGGNVTYYGSAYGTGSGTTDTAPGSGTAGTSTGERIGTLPVGTDTTLNKYDANATIGIGAVTGNVWRDTSSPLDTADQSADPTDVEKAGVTVTPTWSGKTGGSTTTTDSGGDYTLFVPDNVPVTILTPSINNGDRLVYDTSNGPTFNHSEAGISTGITVTATGGGTISDINFAYRVIPIPSTPHTPDPPYLDPINNQQSQFFLAGGAFLYRYSGGREPDWLVGSDVFRVMEAGIPGTANVSADVFYGSAPRQTLRFEAKSVDGSPLPVWLTFDPTMLRFNGTPPEDMEGSVDVKVIASDKNGRQATAEVHIVILKEPASILSMLNVTRSAEGFIAAFPPAPNAPPATPPAATPPAGNDQQPAPPNTQGQGPGTPPPTNDNTPASPSQGSAPQGVRIPGVEGRNIRGFGLSPQLREQSQAARFARSRMLLNALSASSPTESSSSGSSAAL